MSDRDVLTLAAAQGRILVTHDFGTMPRHFAEFLATGATRTGVFLGKQQTPLVPVIDDLLLIRTASMPEDWKDRIVAISLH